MTTLKKGRAIAAMKHLARIADHIVTTRSPIHAKGVVAICLVSFTADKLVAKRTLLAITGITGGIACRGATVTLPLVRHTAGVVVGGAVVVAVFVGCRCNSNALAAIKAGASTSVVCVGRTNVDRKGAVATREPRLAFAAV